MSQEILRQARQRKIKLSVQDGQLRVTARRGQLTPELESAIRSHKAELIELLEEYQRNALNTLPPIKPDQVSGPAPLSFAQQRLWLLDRLQNGSIEYHLPFAIRLPQRLEPALVEQAFRYLLDRHAILRTIYVEEQSGEVHQQVISSSDFQLQQLAPAEPGGQGDDWLSRACSAFVQQPFDLSHDYLLRVAWAETAEGGALLLMNMHHIASDGWSMNILVDEFRQVFAALSAGRQPDLPPLTVSYADYARWQRRHLEGAALSAQLAYWQQQLADLPETHALPLKAPRPARQSIHAATTRRLIPEATLRAIQPLLATTQTTSFMLIHAALAWVLSRYSHSSDIVIGTPVANRRDAALDGLVGFFVNTLVLRLQVSGAHTLSAYLTMVRQCNLQAQANQDLPFEQLVEHLSPARTQSYSPLFQILLSQDSNQQAGEAQSAAAAIQSIASNELVEPTVKFDISVQIHNQAEGLELCFNYASALFSDTMMQALAAAVVDLVQHWAACAEPASTLLHRFSLLDDGQRNDLLEPFNSRPAAGGDYQSLAQRLLDQAAATPTAIAMIAGQRRWQYTELDHISNAIAHHLLANGVVWGGVVAVHLPRSPLNVAVVLALIKAGAAFMPLDPSLPGGRLQQILGQLRPTAIISQASRCEQLPGTDLPVLLLEEEWLDCIEESPPPLIRSWPQQWLYVLFTSGSTGVPKGAINTQYGVVNYLQAAQQSYALSGADRVLHKSPLTFDVSVMEMMWTLSHGAALVVADAEGHGDPGYLAGLIRQHQVTVIDIVPAVLRELLHENELADCDSLRRVQVGGEPLTTSLIHSFQQQQSCPLVNQYGATENSIWLTQWQASVRDDQQVPVGRTLPGVRLYVLDRDQQLAPAGACGELYVGGLAVGGGYLGQPCLTATSFVPDPFSVQPGARMYRSGDLARWLDDGELCLLGRADQQLKIRGLRIEAGDIEHYLLQQPGVAQAAVWPHGQGNARQLVAYIVTKTPLEADAEKAMFSRLKAALREQLPAYMVPPLFMRLPQMPRTSSGKIARGRLPPPAVSDEPAGREPVSDIECALAAIWCELLKCDQVMLEDDFFAIGGHSLLATRMVALIAERLHCELPIAELFEHSRLVDLAALIERLPRSQATMIQRVSRDQLLPQAHTQRRLWFLDQFEQQSSHYNMPLTFRWRGPLDRAALQRALDRLVERHEVLRTRYYQQDQQAWQRVDAAQSVALEEYAVTPEQAAELRELLVKHASRRFDLQHDLMLRAALVRLSENDHVIQFVTHHIAADGWSINLLQADFIHLYQAYAAGRNDSLAELPLQFADYAAWQQQHLQQPQSQQQLAYWRDHLRGMPEVHGLPLDYPRQAVTSMAAHAINTTLDDQLTQSLKQLAAKQNVTLFMLLQSAFAILLARLGDSADIVFGTPVAGRTRRELEPVVGFFANTLVLRQAIDLQHGFEQLLAQSRELCVAAFSHQEVPFELLVETLQPARSNAYAPLVQLLFAMQNHLSDKPSAVDSGTVQVESMSSLSTVSRFEVELMISEKRGRLACRWNFAQRLFDAASGKRIAAYFETLLRGLVAAPQRAVGRLALFDQDDYQRLQRWHSHYLPVPDVTAVHELFARQVWADSQAIAIIDGDQQLTYAEVERRANQLAHALLAMGMEAESIVAVCVDRSADLAISVLAVLKAGAAYLPLDPRYPTDRLRYMLDDAAVGAVLCQPHLQTLPALADYRCLRTDSASGQPSTAPTVTVATQQLAYLIYTSGSTGLPKGVMLHHQGALNLVANQRSVFSLGPGCRVLQFASFSFDAATFEWMMALCSGATLVMCDVQALGSDQALSQFLVDSQISHAVLPPSLLAYLDPHAAYSFTHLIVAGEACDPHLARQWAQRYRLINAYGPTEGTVWASYDAVRTDRVLTIGEPLANVELQLLDEWLQPVPLGAIGELYLGGLGVARGYRQRAALTAERFIPAPAALGGAAGARLYATGDRARWRSDGRLEFHGRSDDQVKIRGYRIELGEIEHALSELAAVKQCAVITARGTHGEQQLIAYIVAAETLPEAAEEQQQWLQQIRVQLAATLPDYMVPSLMRCLPRLPLTANGKLDRQALPQPQSLSADTDEPPASPLEHQLAAIWAELLGMPRVGVSSDFFALGGHSLLALSLVSKVNQQCSTQLSVRELFVHPTVRQLAAYMESDQPAAGWQPLVPLNRHTASQQLFLLPAAGLTVASYAALGSALTGRLNLTMLEARGLNAEQAPHDSLAALCSDYLTALQQAQAEGPYYLAGHSVGGSFAFELASQLQAQGHVVKLVIIDGLLHVDKDASAALNEDQAISRLILQWQQWTAVDTTIPLDQLLDSDAKKRYLADCLVNAGVLPADDHQRLLTALINVYLAQLKLYRNYQPGRQFAGEVGFIHAHEGWSGSALQGAFSRLQQWCVRPVSVLDIDGDHYSLLSQQHAGLLADTLAKMAPRSEESS